MIYSRGDVVYINHIMTTDLVKGQIQYVAKDYPHEGAYRDYALVRVSQDEFFQDIKCYESEIIEDTPENTQRYTKQLRRRELTAQIEELIKERDAL